MNQGLSTMYCNSIVLELGNNIYCNSSRQQQQYYNSTIAILLKYYCVMYILYTVYTVYTVFSLHPHRFQKRRNLRRGLKAHLRWFEPILHLATKTCSGEGKESFGLSMSSQASVEPTKLGQLCCWLFRLCYNQMQRAQLTYTLKLIL